MAKEKKLVNASCRDKSPQGIFKKGAMDLRDLPDRLWRVWNRIWLVLETLFLGYPEPMSHVQARCTRLKMHKSIVPRKMTLVLDLDETLVHSSPKRLLRYDWQVHIQTIDNPVGCTFFVAKRPHIEHFLRVVSRWYEVVVFTASLQHYADPVIDLIDPDGCVSRRFFRNSCLEHKGNFVKDLRAVRSELSQVIIVDNSPTAYSMHEDNALPIQTWFDDQADEALLNLLPVLGGLMLLNDVRSVLSLRQTSPKEKEKERTKEIRTSHG